MHRFLKENKSTDVVQEEGQKQSAQSGATTKLTSSSVIKAWKPINVIDDKTKKGFCVYNRFILLKVIGKSSIIKTKKTALIRYYLTNDADVFRMVVWQDCWSKVWDDLKINHIVHFQNIRFQWMYKEPNSSMPAGLYTDGEFTFATESSLKICQEGSYEEYPTVNEYPPFWRDLKQIKQGESEIAMRVRVLTEMSATKFKKIDGTAREVDGFQIIVGDRNGNKAECFVEFDKDDSLETEMVDGLKSGTEIIIGFAKMFENEKNLALTVDSAEYIWIAGEKNMKEFDQYSNVLISSMPVTTSKPIKRRSAF